MTSTDETAAAEQPKPKKRAHAAVDAAVAVSVNALHELLEAAEKHAVGDERLAAAIAHFHL